MTQKFQPGLYIVATPIGNMDDLSKRSIDAISACDYLACEDSRKAAKLLANIGLKKPFIIYNDFSNDKNRQKILELLKQGKIITLISDAGTPLISDPGYKLVKDVQEANLHIDSIPGPCAAITALTMAALPTDKFIFLGFLPKQQKAKEKLLKQVASLPMSLVIYETANRIFRIAAEIKQILGNRKITIARELTKIHQENIYTDLENIESDLKILKGEIVVTIEGFKQVTMQIDDLEEQIKNDLQQFSAKDLAANLHQEYPQFTKKDIYNYINKLKN